MSNLNSLDELLSREIKDLHNAETQLVEALPEVAKGVSSPELREALELHLEETKDHVTRLEQVSEILGITPRGETCQAMKAFIDQENAIIGAEGEPSVKDLALITAVQKSEHYEIAGYGSARTTAELLERLDVAELLTRTLCEEERADDNLTMIAEHVGKSA
jgi:ferritin-like metal-binding protein YciE